MAFRHAMLVAQLGQFGRENYESGRVLLGLHAKDRVAQSVTKLINLRVGHNVRIFFERSFQKKVVGISYSHLRTELLL